MEYSDNPNQEIDLLKDVAVQVYIGWSICFTYSFSAHGNNIPGGVDTTASTIGTFFLAMVCYPEVQKKAQAELDKVLNGRLPEHSDIASLPYFSALIKEVFRYVAVFFKNVNLNVSASRWETVGPLGEPLFLPDMVSS
jgi:hypothetical protein